MAARKTQPKKTGRPRKFAVDAPRRARFLGALRAGLTRTNAAAAAGISTDTYQRAMAEDAAFAADIEQAEMEAEAFAAGRIRKAMTEAEVTDVYDGRGNLIRTITKYDWKAAAWWLERRRPADWKPTAQTDVNVRGGVQVSGQVDHLIEFRPDEAWLRDAVRILQHTGILPEAPDADPAPAAAAEPTPLPLPAPRPS